MLEENTDLILDEISDRSAEVRSMDATQWHLLGLLVVALLLMVGIRESTSFVTINIDDAIMTTLQLMAGTAAVMGVHIHRNGLRKGTLEWVLSNSSPEAYAKLLPYEQWKSKSSFTPMVGISAVICFVIPVIQLLAGLFFGSWKLHGELWDWKVSIDILIILASVGITVVTPPIAKGQLNKFIKG